MESLAAAFQNYHQPTEVVILKYILDILEKLTCKDSKGYLDRLRRLIYIVPGAIGIVLILILNHYIRSPDKLITLFADYIRPFFENILYRKVSFKYKDDDEPDLATFVDARYSSYETYRGFPVKRYTGVSDSYFQLGVLPIVHHGLIEKITEEAKKDLKEHLLRTDTKCIHDFKEVKPLNLYPSANYLLVDDVVSSYNETCELTGNREPRTIIIDGTHGLGKTRATDFLAKTGKYDNVCCIPMDRYMDAKNSITSLFEKLYKSTISKAKRLSIVIIDEIDKYLVGYIQALYDNHIVTLKKEIKDVAKAIDKEGSKEALELPDFNAFRTQMKEKFLYELLHLIEINYVEHGIVFILCTNNYETIFEDVNMLHFRSLKDRITPLTFKPCDKNELIGYIRYHNNLMKGSRFYYSDEQLDQLLPTIKHNLRVPYRLLTRTMMICANKIEAYIEKMNSWIEDEVCLDIPITSYMALPCSSGFRRPTIEDIDEKSRLELGTFIIKDNGLIPSGRENNARWRDTTELYDCNSDEGCCFNRNIDYCNVTAICVKCREEDFCSCSLEYFGFIHNPDGEGYICPNCSNISYDYMKENIDYPVAADFPDISSETFNEYGYIIRSNSCRRSGLDLPKCDINIRCLDCAYRATCACSLKINGYIENPKGKGYICAKCSKK